MERLICPDCQGDLEQVNDRRPPVTGYCRKDQKEYYRLPNGQMVNRQAWMEIAREYQ